MINSAFYPLRSIEENPITSVPPGFCNHTPDILPRNCTWCGGLMKLEANDTVACDICDHRGAWPDVKWKRRG